jgi:carboxyl-terminal processing protease
MTQPGHKYLRLEGGLLLIGVLLLSACSYLLVSMGHRVNATETISKRDIGDEYYRYSDLMSEIFLQIEDKYVEKVDPQDLFRGAIDGMISTLDPHCSYMGPDSFVFLEQDTEGEFSGIGININIVDGVLTVVAPIPGTPAARKGLLSWDRIIEIDGKSTEGITTDEAVKKLTGAIGTKVDLVVFRPSERRRIPYSIVRDRIRIENVYSNADDGDYVTPYFKKMLKEKKIGYVRITKFTEHVTEDMQKALGRMIDAGAKGLILDLRYNPGGPLDEVIDTCGLFIDADKVVVATKGRMPDQNVTYKTDEPKMVDWPIVVLVNQNSASASEILAGCLKDYKRAILIGPEGQNTYGKGLVQTIAPLRGSLTVDKDQNLEQNALRLTTAKYYTPNNTGPNGKCIQGIGIEPDVTVPLPLFTEARLLREGWMLGARQSGETETIDEMQFEEENSDDSNLENPETPFYLKKNVLPKDRLMTKDAQLKYAVEMARGLLLEKSGEITTNTLWNATVAPKPKGADVFSNTDGATYVTTYFKHLLTDQRIGYVRIGAFSQGAVEGLRSTAERMGKAEPWAWILDLRFASGDSSDALIAASELALSKGDTIQTPTGVRKATTDRAIDKPLVVLVNTQTGPMGSDLAKAIQANHRGMVIAPQFDSKEISIDKPAAPKLGVTPDVKAFMFQTTNDDFLTSEGLLLGLSKKDIKTAADDAETSASKTLAKIRALQDDPNYTIDEQLDFACQLMQTTMTNSDGAK